MLFNSEQERAIYSRQPFIVVAAGAGSGKTRVLTERMVTIIEETFHNPHSAYGASVNEIAAITFTEKAANEMRERLSARMEEKADLAKTSREKSFWFMQIEQVESAMIATFHRFSLQLLKRYSRYIEEKSARSRVLDETESALLKSSVLDSIVKDHQYKEHLRLLLNVMSKQTLIRSVEQIHSSMLEQLPMEEALSLLNAKETWEHQKKLFEEEANRSINQLYHAVMDAAKDLPDKNELTKAMEKHAQNLYRLANEIQEMALGPELIDKIASFMPSRVSKAWEEKLPSLFHLYESYWKPFKKETWPKLSINWEDSFPFLEAFCILIKAFEQQYDRKKQNLNAWDFGDLQQKALALLKQQSIQLGFRHILVDEFQDTNQLQLNLIEHIQPHYVFYVGDEKQSIYRFRGSDVTIMNNLAEKAALQGEEAFIELSENYRTAPQLVSFVNSLFTVAMETQENGPAYATSYSNLSAGRPSFSDSEALASIHLLNEEKPMQTFANLLKDKLDAGTISVEDRSTVRSAKWSDVCVLLPSRTILPDLEEAFLNLKIPYRVNGGVGFFDKQEVIDFLALLNWLRRPYEDAYVIALLRSPLFGLTFSDLLEINNEKSEDQSIASFLAHEGIYQSFKSNDRIYEGLHKYDKWLNDYLPFVPSGSVTNSLLMLFEETGLRYVVLSQQNGLQKVKNIEKLIYMFAQMHVSSLEAMCAQINLYIEASMYTAEAESERSIDEAVTIMTVHASKGLEFPVVCLPQMDRKRRPDTDVFRFHSQMGIVFQLKGDEQTYESPLFMQIKKEMDERGEEEAKRLLYVALTRAKDYCFLAAADLDRSHSWMELIVEARKKNARLPIEWPEIVLDDGTVST
ncbi:UvrD-helicase domain-containing protein [Shouchella patagoniensis]|uniref:UvrD-helicase domain-containing protein n=1 Tax=Shouchella patagoniensis TaxID=228576 RepID=UPI000994B76B|nr:UvrD-helicase domain-containing protein [Shouchella patagoniensis]